MDRRAFLWCLAALLVTAACAQAPVTGRQQLMLVSEDRMDQAGAQACREVVSKQGVSPDQQLQQRVETVGSRIARVSDVADASWEFTVINDPTPNAFALPGGKVGVNVGLFKLVQYDGQLAAVLGHEIAHVAARHAAERISQQMALLRARSRPLLIRAADRTTTFSCVKVREGAPGYRRRARACVTSI